jgi:dTDP-4-dehydrorhamnose 3,5-epimerase-like enzyme
MAILPLLCPKGEVRIVAVSPRQGGEFRGRWVTQICDAYEYRICLASGLEAQITATD